jgi:CubicO group peptidase (beta-lactamase class C family)
LISGEVHDENASVFPEGIAGHAGAFATIAQVQSALLGLLRGELIRQDLLALATRRWTSPSSEQQYGLGFRLADAGGFGGRLSGPGGFGGTGFVGNLFWVEPARGYAVAALSNRVHPVRGDRALFDSWSLSPLDEVSAATS